MSKRLQYVEGDVEPIEYSLLDEEWLEATLSTSVEEYDLTDLPYLYKSEVFMETMDTSLGGHLCLNPPYGFTPGADSYYKGRIMGRVDDDPTSLNYNIGMGRYYKEAIQNNAEVRTLSLEYGVPEFQSIISFLAGAVDYAKTIIAIEGRSPKWYYTGRAAGGYVAFVANPVLYTSFFVLSSLYSITFGVSDPRFYTLKPDMKTFYSSWNNLMQLSAAERGFTRFEMVDPSPKERGTRIKIAEEDKKDLHNTMPSIFGESGTIDTVAIVSKYQRMMLQRTADIAQVYDKAEVAKAESLTEISKEMEVLNGSIAPKDGFTTEALYKELMDNKDLVGMSRQDEEDKASKEIMNREVETLTDKEVQELANQNLMDDKSMRRNGHNLYDQTDNRSWVKSGWEYFKSATTNTSNAIFLQVEYLGPSNDSFSNSLKDIPLKSMMDTAGGAMRDLRFSMGAMDLLGKTVSDTIKAGRDVVWGVVDEASYGLTNVIHSLIGGGFVDLPKMWADSSANIGGHDFKIVINPPYGNTASLIIELDLVLYALFAGTLPRSIGRSAYASPMLCKAFIPGSVNIDFGMITNLTVTRASGNMAQNQNGAPLGIEINFTISDFNEVFTAPIDDGFLGAYNVSLDDHLMISKYVRSVAGSSYSDNKFIRRRAMKRINALYGNVSSRLSPQTLAFMVGSNGLSKTFHPLADLYTSQLSGVWMYNENL